VLHLTVEGAGEERVVTWGYECGSWCRDHGGAVRFTWGADIMVDAIDTLA
jgi:hypothetical protein